MARQTLDGVRKEVQAFTLAYQLVRSVMATAGEQQNVPADRISFIDALRQLRQAQPDEPVPKLPVHPERPCHFEPSVVKHRPKNYKRLTRSRNELKETLINKAK